MSDIVPTQILHQHKDIIRSLAFSPDGELLASLSILNDNSIILWSTADWLPKKQFFSGPGTTEIWFNVEGTTLIGTGVNMEIRLWDISSGLERIVPTLDRNGKVRFSSSGTAYLVCCGDDTLTFYQLETQQILKHLSPPRSFSAIIQHCGWLNGDATLLAVEDRNHIIQIWDIEQQQIVTSLVGHSSSIRDISFNAPGSLLASVSEDGIVNVWNLVQGNLVSMFQSAASDIREIYFNPKLPLLAIVNGEDYIELWDRLTGTLRARLLGHESQITMAFSPNGKLLVSGSDDSKIRIWSL